ncbi:MAG: ribonuclease P protein component [Candidatus Omnitrophota bacterium]|nr:ribonuclease P protein component [Candidatus Omnitrophota bacterium]
MGLNSFPLKERLKKNDAIKAVLDNGVFHRARSVNIYILKKAVGDGLKPSPTNRAAFICKKSLHQKKSVLRNRIRRILREAYRNTKRILPTGFDIVIVATKVNQSTLSTAIEREIHDVFKKYTDK